MYDNLPTTVLHARPRHHAGILAFLCVVLSSVCYANDVSASQQSDVRTLNHPSTGAGGPEVATTSMHHAQAAKPYVMPRWLARQTRLSLLSMQESERTGARLAARNHREMSAPEYTAPYAVRSQRRLERLSVQMSRAGLIPGRPADWDPEADAALARILTKRTHRKWNEYVERNKGVSLGEYWFACVRIAVLNVGPRSICYRELLLRACCVRDRSASGRANVWWSLPVIVHHV